MKRKTKRILCAALSTVMATSLIAESALHINAERTAAETKATESVSFTNATGKFDLSQITLANLNAKVVEAFDRNKSEKKTVIVSLKGDALLDTANGQSVPEYASTNAAQAVLEKIEEKQDAFLRRLTGSKIGYTLKHRYSVIDNALAIEVEESSVVSIKEMPEVETVVISQGYAVPKTLDVDPTSVGSAVSNSANANKTGIYNSAGYTDYSAGTVVAVLDTGLDYTHAAYQTPPPSATLALKQTGVQTLLDSKAFAAEDRTALGGNVLSASDVYVSDKVPFAYDYADDDPDVYPSYSNHGTHVAGIVAGQADSYTNKDGEIAKYQEGDVIPSGYAVGDPIPFTGVAPDAQLVICKVFTDDLDDEDLGGAVAEDILAALQDCVLLGVDVINMSLGTSAGFSAEGGDSEGDYLDSVYKSIQDAGISLICAASNDYSSAYGSAFGTNLTSNPDSGTVGSPSTFSAALSVASISGQKSEYFIANEGTDKEFAVYYLEANDKYNNPIDFFDGMLGESATGGELEYVVVPGTGLATNYTAQVKRLFNEKPYQRIALVKRGSNTFEEKVRIAMNNKAAGVIVYNNVAGEIRMSLGELESPVPSVSIDREAGEMMASVVTKSNRLGTIRLDRSLSAGPFMSDFSSWGPTPDLRLKPEITAHGGEITSTVPGGYGEQSGTSMASPNMAGFVALARSYIKQNMSAVLSEMTGSGLKEAVAINRLVNQLVMSTATTAYDEDGYPYSPRKQGAGLANIANVIGGTGAYLYTENADTDYRPKAELFDKLNEKDNIEVEFYIHNFSSSSLTYELQTLVMTEAVEKYDGFAVAEQAYMLDDNPAVWYIGDSTDAHTGDLTVAAGQKVKIRAVITLSDKEKEYFENFENGMYLEGFVKLISKTQGQCDMTLPFLGFYGDWSAAPMLDLTVYEVTADEKDASLKDEEKKKARVWATQPYASYYNEDYIIPMGSFVYLLPDEAEDMWTNEDYGAISRYNIYFGENEEGNYLTTTSLRAVYAGLLRNARTVNYTLENAVTGELIKESSINRVGKAYTAGSSGVPANVELKLAPEDYGLVSGGKYKMSFEFFLDYGDGSATDNLFEFTFYVDYEAPVLEDARVRYDNYKDGNKNKQKIFLEFDIYDNHYAQSLMLCYPDFQYNFETGEQEKVLKLATEYVTPVRNAKKNGITTVSIEVTDIYDKIKNEFYVQLDDYALNNSLFALQINSSNDQTATNVTPDDFALAEGEDQITVDVYGTHKVALVYEGKADLSNFHWRSLNPNAIGVKNGEIVGLRAGAKGRVVVSNGKGVEKYVNVTVSNTTLALDIPSISFSEMMSTDDWLTKAQGSVEVFADKEFTLNIVTDPWYYPVEDLDILWTSTNESIVTVTQEGVVNTLQKGTASIIAYICENGKPTNFSANVQLRVQDEFRIGNYTLQQYNGIGHNGVICPHCHSAWAYTELETVTEGDVRVDGICPTPACLQAKRVIKDCDDTVLKIPDDRNIMYIGENAFKDNDNVKKLVIPKTVMDIQKRAFVNCSALEEIYFVDTVAKEIADADIKLVYQEAFYNCSALKLLDLSNCKTFTVADRAFKDCVSLIEVRKAENIGTMNHYAFSGCTSLSSIDLSGLHMSGNYVFQGCSNLSQVTTGKFTAIGNYMFNGCNNLKEITIKTGKIGIGAFENCTSLQTVAFDLEDGVQAEISDRAFKGCTSLSTLTYAGTEIRSIGKQAFANTALTSFVIPASVETLGGEFLKGSLVTEITLSDSVDVSTVSLSGVSFAGLNIVIPADSTVYYQDTANKIIYNADKTKVLFASNATGEVSLLDTVTEIVAYAFAGSGVTKVTVPSGLEKIGEGAFQNSSLKELDLSQAQVTEIAAYTFQDSALATFALPALKVMNSIGEFAFAGTSLTSLTVALANGANIGSYAFERSALGEIDLTGEAVFGDGVFQNSTSLTSVKMQTLALGQFTFYGCTALNSVIFYDGSTALGQFTFTGTPVETVLIPTTVKEIEDGGAYFANGQIKTGGTFSDTPNLTQFDFIELERIGSYAFENSAISTFFNERNVKVIGDYAFRNCSGLQQVSFDKVTDIGNYAFAIENGKDAYTAINFPSVINIGEYAFKGGKMTSIALPATLEKIGDGAFSYATSLSEFTTDIDLEKFVVNGGVLFEKVGSQLKLVCYGAGLTAVSVYTVPDGTVAIQANAFSGLKENAIEKVVLPYSVKTVGDGAFLDSGVSVFEFQSVIAPTLESKYDEETAAWFYAYADESGLRPYYGYFYTNFGGSFKDYTDYVGDESPLTIYYPVNGIGYDNPIYKTYFGERQVTAEVIDDTTRAFRDLMATLPSLGEVNAWKSGGESNRQAVLDTAETLSAARAYFNAIKAESQLAFLDADAKQQLMDYESAMREVKAAYGITVNVQRIYYEAEGYKKNYLVGETFDSTGLEIIVLYDDGSSEVASFDDFTLLTNRPLTKNDVYVEFSGLGKTVRVDVTVTEETSSSSSSSSSSAESGNEGGCGGSVQGAGIVAAVTLAVAAAFILKKKGNAQ